MLTSFGVRYRLVNMGTLENEVFGVLTVRKSVGITSVRWTVSDGQTVTTFRYPIYCEAMLMRGDVDQIAVRQKALLMAVDYIMAHYEGVGLAA